MAATNAPARAVAVSRAEVKVGNMANPFSGLANLDWFTTISMQVACQFEII
jgi:hypothetical protein